MTESQVLRASFQARSGWQLNSCAIPLLHRQNIVQTSCLNEPSGVGHRTATSTVVVISSVEEVCFVVSLVVIIGGNIVVVEIVVGRVVV